MNELIGINIYEMLPQIIEYFVKFYGEEYRELITERLSSIKINLYGNPENIPSYISLKKKEIVASLAEEYIKKLGYEPTKELIKKLFNLCNSIEGSPIDEIYELFKEEQSPFEKKRAEISLNSLLEHLQIEKDSPEEKELLEKIVKNQETFKLLKLKELALKQIYEPMDREIDETNRLKRRRIIEANIEILKEFKFLLDEHDKEILNSQEINFNLLHCKEVLIGKTFDSKLPIEYFTKESEENLTEENNYFRQRVKENRIKYFKSKGIDLGNDYEPYEKSEECQKIKPSFEIAEKIKERRETYKKRIIEECIAKGKEYRSIIESNAKLNLKDNEVFNPSLAREGNTYVSTNFVEENNMFKFCPVLYYCYTKNMDYSDVLLIHELNHIVELMLLEVNENKISLKTGFEFITDEIGKVEEIQSFKNKKRRNTELFNETINQIIAEDITKMMHEDGFYIFNDKNKNGIYGIANTSIAHPLIRPFYEYYKKEITECRLNGNMEPLFEIIGEENFYALNEQIIELITSINHYTLNYDKHAKKTTPTTEKYDEIRDNIFKIYTEIKQHEISMKETKVAK